MPKFEFVKLKVAYKNDYKLLCLKINKINQNMQDSSKYIIMPTFPTLPVLPNEPIKSKICTECKLKESNPGKRWCQDCFIRYKNRQKCTTCKVNVANPDRMLCETCYINLKKLPTLNEFISEVEQIKENSQILSNNVLGSIPSTLRHEVWKKYISDTFRKGKCFCCRSALIEESNFECGHVVSRKNGGPINLENLRPICSQCNKSMSSKDMDTFIISCGFWKKNV